MTNRWLSNEWPTLRRAALLGAATGSRSTLGLTALTLSAREGALARPPARIGLQLATAVELVVDKLPITPSRLQARGLVSRIVAGAAGGLLLARREGPSSAGTYLAAAVVGSLAATKTAFIGAAGRGYLGRRLGTDLPGALVEDLAAIALAAIAVAGTSTH